MVARVSTVAFQGIEGVPVEVQVMVAPGRAGIQIVGLPDKAVAESRERVQAALHASGLALPPKKVTVNLAPADLPKEGTHFDLPIALGILAYVSGRVDFSNFLDIMYLPGTGELAVYCAAMVGACFGFMWYNTYPAEVFMGDVGALGYGQRAVGDGGGFPPSKRGECHETSHGDVLLPGRTCGAR